MSGSDSGFAWFRFVSDSGFHFEKQWGSMVILRPDMPAERYDVVCCK